MRKKRHEAATELSFVFVCVGENDLLTVTSVNENLPHLRFD
jgi:hypothetical protein